MMAGRRLARTAVDWVALTEKVPARQKDALRVLKTGTDKYVNKLADLPESLPKIDFSEYSRRITNTAFVNEFEKLYNALEVPYPKDSANVSTTLKAAEKIEMQKKDVFVAEKNLRSENLNSVLEIMDNVPGVDKMTMQMYNHYFPEAAINPNRENPGFFPQNVRKFQYDSEEFGMYYNTRYDRKGVYSLEEAEMEIRLEMEEKNAEYERQLENEKKKIDEK